MLEVAATLAGLLFGAIGTLLAVRSHVRTIRKEWEQKWDAETKSKVESEKKAYAAERDFNHLRNNQEQMKQAIQDLQEEIEKLTEAAIEFRTSMRYNQPRDRPTDDAAKNSIS